MRIGLSPRRTQALMSALLIAAAPAAALAAPQDRYYERSFVLAANDRCGLFEPQLTAALTAAAYFWTSLSRAWLFWIAFILTRPLGATVGDFLDKPVGEGGLAMSRPIATAGGR